MNITEYDPDALATYNPGCYDEITKFAQTCTDFKVDVIANFSNRLRIVIIILVALIFLRMFLYYRRPKFVETEFYKNKIEYRLDFIIMIIGLIAIAYLFI